MNAKEKLLELVEKEGLTFGTCVSVFAEHRDETDLAFVTAAQLQAVEGELEVDDNAMTSRADDEEGCYVMAWVWVDGPLAGAELNVGEES